MFIDIFGSEKAFKNGFRLSSKSILSQLSFTFLVNYSFFQFLLTIFVIDFSFCIRVEDIESFRDETEFFVWLILIIMLQAGMIFERQLFITK